MDLRALESKLGVLLLGTGLEARSRLHKEEQRGWRVADLYLCRVRDVAAPPQRSLKAPRNT